jgi:hypothetical protein
LLIADVLSGDCAAAAIVLGVDHPCKGPRLKINRRDAIESGGEAVWLNASTAPVVETVQGERGARPWSLTPHADQ